MDKELSITHLSCGCDWDGKRWWYCAQHECPDAAPPKEGNPPPEIRCANRAISNHPGPEGVGVVPTPRGGITPSVPPPSDAAPVDLPRYHCGQPGCRGHKDSAAKCVPHQLPWSDVCPRCGLLVFSTENIDPAAAPRERPRPDKESECTTVPDGSRSGQVEDAEWEKSFDLYHDAIQRGTKIWQEATGRVEVLPDVAKLVAWLLDLVHRAEDAPESRDSVPPGGPWEEGFAPPHETVLARDDKGDIYQARVCYGMHEPFWCGHSGLNSGKILENEGITVTHWMHRDALNRLLGDENG